MKPKQLKLITKALSEIVDTLDQIESHIYHISPTGVDVETLQRYNSYARETVRELERTIKK